MIRINRDIDSIIDDIDNQLLYNANDITMSY